MFVIIAKHAAQIGYLIGVECKAHMIEKLVAWFEFVTVGGKGTACVSIITQGVRTYKPFQYLCADTKRSTAVGHSLLSVTRLGLCRRQ